MKTIAIIGGGISGCALLHFLNQRFSGRTDIKIQLFEKSSRLGGNVQTINEDGYLFETGPNGFQANERTLSFLKELGLDRELITSNKAAKIRFLCVNNQLHVLPNNLKTFFKFPLLTSGAKWRALAEIFIPKGKRSRESVYEFGVRRLGKEITDTFLDPMVHGIHGGDVKKLVAKYAFPKIYGMEQRSGSLLGAQLASGKKKSPALMSFKSGMGDLIKTIHERYKDQIFLNYDVRTISKEDNRYIVRTSVQNFKADEIFLCVPAFVASDLIGKENQLWADSLKQIAYAPIAVVGLAYDQSPEINDTAGYGYLKPSKEESPLLGVLFEHQIFPGRAPDKQFLYRVMIGGSRYPEIVSMDKEDLVKLAIEELSKVLKITVEPKQVFFQFFKNAIPQYNQSYAEVVEQIRLISGQYTNLHLLANYWNGISFNDCIENAYQASRELKDP